MPLAAIARTFMDSLVQTFLGTLGVHDTVHTVRLIATIKLMKHQCIRKMRSIMKLEGSEDGEEEFTEDGKWELGVSANF